MRTKHAGRFSRKKLVKLAIVGGCGYSLVRIRWSSYSIPAAVIAYRNRTSPRPLKWLGRIRELYRLNRERLQHELGSAEYIAADAKLREHVAMIALKRDAELSLAELQPAQLHYECLPALKSLREHWTGLTLFVDDPMVPLDNNYGERLIRNPAIGRKNYYGSGSEWSGRLAMMMFFIFATLLLWKINPRTWLTWYFESCAANAGQAPAGVENF